MIKPKITGFFFELTEFGMMAMRANHFKTPLTVQSIHESPLLGIDQTRAFVKDITGAGPKQMSGAHVAFYPESRFLHEADLDEPMKARDDPKHLPNLLLDRFTIDASTNNVAVINPIDGSPFGIPPLPQRILFAGAPNAEVARAQDYMVRAHVYPDHFEVGTFATMGGLMSYFQFQQLKAPTLVMEFSSKGVIMVIFRDGMPGTVRTIRQGFDSFLPEFQEETGISDPAAAKQKLIAGDFDQARLVPIILAKLNKELQSFKSFYELQYTTRIEHLICTMLPNSMSWLPASIAGHLEISQIQIDYPSWLDAMQITLDSSINPHDLTTRHLGLFSMMVHFHPNGPVSDNPGQPKVAAVQEPAVPTSSSTHLQFKTPDAEPQLPVEPASIAEPEPAPVPEPETPQVRAPEPEAPAAAHQPPVAEKPEKPAPRQFTIELPEVPAEDAQPEPSAQQEDTPPPPAPPSGGGGLKFKDDDTPQNP